MTVCFVCETELFDLNSTDLNVLLKFVLNFCLILSPLEWYLRNFKTQECALYSVGCNEM